MPIIKSLMDTDLYKLTMQQLVFHQFPDVKVEYTFKNRTTNTNLSSIMEDLEKEIDYLCTLKFTNDELDYLNGIHYFKSDYVGFLGDFKFDRNLLNIFSDKGNLGLKITGSWLSTILFEIPLLAIINELYFRRFPNPDYDGAWNRFLNKVELVKNTGDSFKFADFGTRRRFSFKWQQKIIKFLAESEINRKSFIGTSNVLLAKKFKVNPIGTQGHEIFQAAQGITDIRNSQKFMLQKWLDEYGSDLGIALSDTLGLDNFLIDFDFSLSSKYSGVRQDSGDPYIACDKIFEHYKAMNINPIDKSVVFSDGLNFIKARDLLEEYGNRTKVAFGIGTNLTNDFPNLKPIQIVIKMTRCNGQPVAKISDSVDKSMCEDEEYIEKLRKILAEKKQRLT
ncbi:MAG: nicotinate phosphoribosyltransferase [Promethearchaeota archaeon]